MTRSHTVAAAHASRARHWLLGLGNWLELCMQRARQRKALSELSDHQLRDIGLTREQIKLEIAKPPWR